MSNRTPIDVMDWSKLAWKIANKYKWATYSPVEDLYQDAMVGIIEAAKVFDDERGEFKHLAYNKASTEVRKKIFSIVNKESVPIKNRFTYVEALDRWEKAREERPCFNDQETYINFCVEEIEVQSIINSLDIEQKDKDYLLLLIEDGNQKGNVVDKLYQKENNIRTRQWFNTIKRRLINKVKERYLECSY